MSDSKTILVVDDSRVSRMMVAKYVHKRNPDWILAEAGSGEEAVKVAELVKPYITFLDVNMKGIGGIAAAGQLREMFPKMHMTLLTANMQPTVRERAEALGIYFIQKPFDEASIHEYLDYLDTMP